MHEKVWVAYIDDQQKSYYLALDYEPGMTAGQAIERSGLLEKTQLNAPLQLGIFGVKIADEQHILSAGDRVEIYRPLKINPKDIRRNRADKNPTSRYLMKQRARGNRFRHSG